MKTPLSSLQRTAAAADGGLRISVAEIDPATLRQKLPVGSTLTARIVEAHDNNRYTVQFAGLRMIAESSLPLSPGARLPVQVAAHEPKIHLKLLDQSPGEAMDRVLAKLGYDQPSPELKELVGEMMERGLPLENEAVRKGMTAIKQGLTPREAVRLVVSDAPLSGAVLERARAGEAPVTVVLEKLQQLLRDSGRPAEAERIGKALTFDGDLEKLLERHPLKEERRLLGDAPEKLRGDVRSLLLTLAREKAADSASARPAGAPAARTAAPSERRAAADAAPVAGGAIESPTSAKARAETKSAATAETPGERSATASAPPPDRTATDSESPDTAWGDTEVAQAARELIETLESPYLFGEPSSEIRFVVEDDGKREASLAAQRSPERTVVRFRLETSRLGPVFGAIDFRGRHAGLALGVESTASRQALRQALPELNTSLAALGFTVDGATVDLRQDKPAGAPPVTGLDIRA